MPDEIIEVSKREPIPQDELLQEMGKIVLHPPEKQTLTEELNEPLLTMTRAIHSEFDQISKSILLSQNQIDVEAEAFELQMKRVAGGLKAHLAFLKKSEENSRNAEDLFRSSKALNDKFQSTIDKLVNLQPNLPPDLAITSLKMLKRFPVLSNFLKSR